MSECAQIFLNNVAEALGGQIITARYIDIMEPKGESTESAEEIIARISDGLNELGEEYERI